MGEPLKVEVLVQEIVYDIETRPYFQHADVYIPDWILRIEVQSEELNKIPKWLDNEIQLAAQDFYDSMNISPEMLKKDEYRNAIIRVMRPENRNSLKGEKASECRKKLDFLMRFKKIIDFRLSKRVKTE